MKRTIVAVILVVVLLAGCGNKKPKSNVTLTDMTKYEHSVTVAADPGKQDTQIVKDADGYTVVSDTVYVTSNTLNIRVQPGTDTDVLKTVPYGTALQRTGKGDFGWDRIYFENTTAYVSNDYITSLTILENRTFEYSNAMLSIVDTSRQIYDYRSMCEDLAELRERYGDHMKLNCIGTTKDDRSIFEIVIGDPEKAKKHVFFCGGICGAEYMTSLLCMKQAEYCLCYYDSGNYNGFAYRELCENAVIHVIPMLNPDGIAISQQYLSGVHSEEIITDLKKWFERDSVKGGTSLSLDNYLMFFYANANGVDLRRNFRYLWENSDTGVTEPSSEGYPGAEPESEPETLALIRQLTGTKPDLIVAYHTTGSNISYNYGQSEPRLSQAKRYAEAAAEVMNYDVNKENAGFRSYGSYEGYCCLERGIPTLGIALGSGATPLSLNEFNAIWNACRESWAVLQLQVIDY